MVDAAPPASADGFSRPVNAITALGTRLARVLTFAARFQSAPASEDLAHYKSLTPEMVMLLGRPPMKAKLNIIISGGTGLPGKTTLNSTRLLYSSSRTKTAIVTNRDAARTSIASRPRSVRLGTRPANIEGQGSRSKLTEPRPQLSP